MRNEDSLLKKVSAGNMIILPWEKAKCSIPDTYR